FPIAIHNPDPSDIDFSDIDENGIWEIETEFSGYLDNSCIGVMKDSFNFSAGQHSTNYSDYIITDQYVIRIIGYLEMKDIQQVRK
ncbi:MAG: hypothetical protein EZS28_054438, partial [Streblomastix strix]